MAQATLRFIEGVLWRWVKLCERFALWVLLAVLGLTVAAGYVAATTLKVNTDSSEMLDSRLPFRQRALELKALFPHLSDSVLVVVRAPTADEADGFAGALAARLTARDEAVSDAFSAVSDPFFVENGLLYLSERELSSLLSRLSQAAPLLETLVADPSLDSFFGGLADNIKLAEGARLGAEALDRVYAEIAAVVEAQTVGEPRALAWSAIFDAEDAGRPAYVQRVVTVKPKLDFEALQPARAALRAIDEEIAGLSDAKFARVEVGVTGDPALRTEELRSVSEGIGVSFLISFAAVAALLVIALRSPIMVAGALLTLIATLVLTAGFAALAIGALNLVSIAFTVLLVGLGLDYAIHLLLHVREHRLDGRNLRQALIRAVREVGGALALCVPTTALAFLAFTPTKFVGMAQLGVISAAGVFIAFAATVTLLPAFLTLAPAPRVREPSRARLDSLRRFGARISRPLALGTVILGVAALALLPYVRFDADPMALRDPDSASVRTFAWLFDEASTTPYQLQVVAEDLQAAAPIAARLSALPEVAETRTLSDFVPKDQDIKLELIDLAAGTLSFSLEGGPGRGAEELAGSGAPQADGRAGVAALEAALADLDAPSRNAVRLAQSLEAFQADDPAARRDLEARIFAFWPMQLDRLRRQLYPEAVELATLPAALSERYVSETGAARVEVSPALDVQDATARERFIEAVSAVAPDATGSALTVLKAGETVSAAMVQATLFAAAIVSVFLWFLLRDTYMVALILAPLILAAVLTSAAGVLFDLPYNLANVIVLPLLIGLGVDSGIHLVLRTRKLGGGSAVFATSTPRAVFFSALTTIASFGSLSLSAHRGTASMGALLTIAVAFTLLCTLVVLPAVMELGRRRIDPASDV